MAREESSHMREQVLHRGALTEREGDLRRAERVGIGGEEQDVELRGGLAAVA
jgi:hypothetical protein